GTESGVYFRGPETPEEETYANAYLKKWGEYPPPPYPKSSDEIKICDEFREKARGLQDLRRFNLPIPTNRPQLEYVYEFYARYGMPPAPPYPSDDNFAEEAKAVFTYVDRHGFDPHRLYSKGTPAWSIWFHVTDPGWMFAVQFAIILVTLLFTIGFCTRITSVLTWV